MITCLSSRCVFCCFYHYNLVSVCLSSQCFQPEAHIWVSQHIKTMTKQEKKRVSDAELWARDQLRHSSDGYQYRIPTSVFNVDYRVSQCTKTTDTTKAGVSTGMCTWLAHKHVLQVRSPLDIRLWSDQWFVSFPPQVSSCVELQRGSGEEQWKSWVTHCGDVQKKHWEM